MLSKAAKEFNIDKLENHHNKKPGQSPAFTPEEETYLFCSFILKMNDFELPLN
jgi:hypothetical protein